MKRIPGRVVVAVLVALALLHTVAWFAICNQVASGLKAWVGLQRAEGLTVAMGPVRRSGWPLAAGVSVADPMLGSPAASWTAGRIDLVWRPWEPNWLGIRPVGRQVVTAGANRIVATARMFDLALRLPDGGGVAFDVDGLAVDLPAPNVPGTLTAGRIEGQVTRGPGGSASEPAASFDITATAVHLPAGPAYLLGPDIAEFNAGGMLSGPVPDPAPLAQRAAAWRDGGGAARLDHFGLTWGKVSMNGNGRASLDHALQPVVDLSVHLMGQNEALDGMVAQGLVTTRAATVARAVLGMFSRASPGTDGTPAPLPIGLRDGTVSLGGIPVARTPPIAWP